MKTIIQRIESGDLNRDIDEKGAGGFWDLAGEKAEDYVANTLPEKVLPMADSEYWKLVEYVQEKLYNDYWELYEEATGYVDPRDIPF